MAGKATFKMVVSRLTTSRLMHSTGKVTHRCWAVIASLLVPIPG